MHSEFAHRPVLLDEVLTGLSIRRDGIYVDGTYGRGGHASAILQRLDTNGRLMVIDKDPQAIASARQVFSQDNRVVIEQGSFAMIEQLVTQQDWLGRVNGILLDLGVSSPQFDNPERGFSFRHDGALDMRMNPDEGKSAAQWLRQVSEKELAEVFRHYGEERYARRIARAIVRYRQTQEITTTLQLSQIIAQAHPAWERGKDPATRCFQAIRIYINKELEELQASLPQTLNCLAVRGRLVVISFHSLEDRIVKRFISQQSRGDRYPIDLPVTVDQLQPMLKPVGKAVYPSQNEVNDNPRARSAIMRIAERSDN